MSVRHAQHVLVLVTTVWVVRPKAKERGLIAGQQRPDTIRPNGEGESFFAERLVHRSREGKRRRVGANVPDVTTTPPPYTCLQAYGTQRLATNESPPFGANGVQHALRMSPPDNPPRCGLFLRDWPPNLHGVCISGGARTLVPSSSRWRVSRTTREIILRAACCRHPVVGFSEINTHATNVNKIDTLLPRFLAIVFTLLPFRTCVFSANRLLQVSSVPRKCTLEAPSRPRVTY